MTSFQWFCDTSNEAVKVFEDVAPFKKLLVLYSYNESLTFKVTTT